MNCSEASELIRRELFALGWTRDHKAQRVVLLSPPDGARRIVFLRRVVRVERGGRGRWTKDRSSAWDQGEWKALGIVQAAELLGKGVLP